MSAFPNWEDFVVAQKAKKTGCIPWSYEIILRASEVEGINFGTFQDDFNLDKGLEKDPENNFESVAGAIRKKYPTIEFGYKLFEKGEGQKKLAFIEERIARKSPVLVSISMIPYGYNGWHIMPVVDSTSDSLILLWGINAQGVPDARPMLKTELVRIHENFPGGNDVAYLKI